jgi:hypothetical protein
VEIAQPKDINRIKDLWQELFKDSEEFANYYFTEKIKTNEILIHNNQDQLISMLHLNPYEVIINEFQEETAYIVGVGTNPQFQNKGYMRLLMEAAIKRLYEQNKAFCFLMPVDERIYTRFGFSFIQDHYEYYTHQKDILNEYQMDTYVIKSMVDQPLDEIIKFYNSYVSTHFNTFVSRSSNTFKLIFEEIKSESGEIIGFYNQDVLKGYIMFYNQPELCDIREIIFDDYKTLEVILAYINTNIEPKEVKVRSHTSDLKHYLPYTTENKLIIKPAIMGRIINIYSFLGSFKSDQDYTLTLSVKDTVIEQNNNTFHWKISPFDSRIQQVKSKPDIELDIGTLLQWLMGYSSFQDLVLRNKIKIYTPEAVENIHYIQCSKAVYMNEVV